MPSNQANTPIKFKLEPEIPHVRVISIGILQGSWNEMGIQYGQRCAEDIARNFDLGFKNQVIDSEKGIWQEGRTEKERGEYCRAYIERSHKELSYLSPELIDFIDGICQGAAKQLDKCKFNAVMPHPLKIHLLNYSGLHFHPNWDFDNDRPNGLRKENLKTSGEDHDCNGFWVKGGATPTGATLALRAAQGRHLKPGGSGRERQVSYVAIPKDPRARVFWGTGRAGNLGGGAGGGVLNDRGVCALTSGSQKEVANSRPDETLAPGIKGFILGTFGVIFSDTARQAAEIATVGTDTYRKASGRKTVLRVRGANIVFADANEAYCVEQNARNYAIREPGDLGEQDGNFMVNANHFKYDQGSFDQNNVFQADVPMTAFTPEQDQKKDSSYFRFWSGMWMLSNNYGRIDREMVMRDLACAHYAYDREGQRYDPDAATGTPTVPGTFCAHMKPFTPENPMGIGGNTETTLFNLSTREVWWVPVWPCHYKDWNLSWSYPNLEPFSEYRKLLWGY